MRAHTRYFTPIAFLVTSAIGVVACGDPEIINPAGPGGNGGTTTSTGGKGGSAGNGGAGGDGNILVGGGGSTSSSTTNDPCDGVACDTDQHCENVEGKGSCVNNTCAEIMCGATEICDVGPNGGAVCKDISCVGDVECPPSQYCNGTICVDDLCTPGVAECMGDQVFACLPSGAGTALKFTCGSEAYFTSVCSGDGMGSATCTCEDDWDCPQFTACDISICQGTGKAPTCSLPPVAFSNALPNN